MTPPSVKQQIQAQLGAFNESSNDSQTPNTRPKEPNHDEFINLELDPRFPQYNRLLMSQHSQQSLDSQPDSLVDGPSSSLKFMSQLKSSTQQTYTP